MALSEEINALEKRLTQLLGVMENMASANETLRNNEQALREECEQLREKNEQAGTQIENILNKLKQPSGQSES
ncbi:MAG: Unknown protein [uncultured Thiotrichaceae bacterium]|uniref:Cell division protein ZapB n=1 Tax=uncultured Thiotrichaceae bacterium TaxID=298394 RepID=A0A6S6U9Y0_9GAMM|nr:MAG: Unknown protein [uncultured Thiotrichaceae bacterium]